MAASMDSLASASILSQKQRKALLKKERRKRKRQALAQARGQGEEDEESDAVDEEEAAEKESQRLHAVWLERERLAQGEFKQRYEREETARLRKEEEERRIKEEWDAQEKKEEEDKEQKLQEKRERETKRNTLAININSQDMDEAVQKMLDQAESQLENGGPWMNPEAPVTENSVNYGTERDIANCPFFLKTGACRFGDRCSRKHVHPASSPTLMIRAMFVTFGMEQCRRDDYDTDACLEHSEEDLQEYFLEFYHDVLPEFKSVGKVLQFKVSCNFEPHLRGNVYVQFDTEEQCRDAFVKFNGRWYAQKQLHCEICPVTRWKNAICGLFDRQKCPKGKHCNFLHVFRNPGNEFWEADRDLHMSPDRGGDGSYRAGRYSERCGERSWRQRNGSRSPPRSERSSYSRRGSPPRSERSSYSRRGSERRRSRSRSRERSLDSRASHHQRADNRSSWSRSVSSRKEHYRSRSRERGRSRSRSGERDQNRTRNKDRERDKHRSRSRDRLSETVPGELERARDRSRSRSPHRQSRESSPKKSDRKDKTPDDTHTPRRHKHSKKSKKKSKKKHKKKKSCSPGGPASSDESEEEEQGERNHPAASPGEEVNEVELVQNAGGDAVVNSSGDTNTETMSAPEVKSISFSGPK